MKFKSSSSRVHIYNNYVFIAILKNGLIYYFVLNGNNNFETRQNFTRFNSMLILFDRNLLIRYKILINFKRRINYSLCILYNLTIKILISNIVYLLIALNYIKKKKCKTLCIQSKSN